MFYTNYTWDLDGHGFQVSASSKSFQLYNLLVTRPLGVWNGVHCLNSHSDFICIGRVKRGLGWKIVNRNRDKRVTSRPRQPLAIQRQKYQHQLQRSLFNSDCRWQIFFNKGIFECFSLSWFTEFWEAMQTQVQFFCLYLVCLFPVSCQPGEKRDLITPKCQKEDESLVFQWKLASTTRLSWFFLLPTAISSHQQARSTVNQGCVCFTFRLYLTNFDFLSRRLIRNVTQELLLPSAVLNSVLNSAFIVGKKPEPRNQVSPFFLGKTLKNTQNREKYSKSNFGYPEKYYWEEYTKFGTERSSKLGEILRKSGNILGKKVLTSSW